MNLRNKLAFFIALNSYVELITRGTSPLSLPSAVANSLSYVKAFGGTEQRNLPNEYTELEYIEGTGTQYITTDITANQDTSAEIKFVPTSVYPSNAVFGARTSKTSDAFNVWLPGIDGGIVSNLGTLGAVTTNTEPILNEVYVMYLSKTRFAVNNLVTNISNVTDFVTPGGIQIFNIYGGAATVSASATSTNRIASGKVYYFKIWQNNTLTHNFIPAKNASGVVGMYDTVSGTFFTNAGTGTFAAGGEAVPTPDAPMDIVSNNGVLKYGVLGKNLFNVSANPLEQGGIASSDGQNAATSYDQRVRTNGYIPVKPSTVYTASVKDLQIYYLEYTQDKTYTDRHASGFSDNSVTFTTGANTYFIRLQFRKSNNSNILPSEVTNVQLEQGSTATEYEPYREGVYTDGTVETIGIRTRNLYDANSNKAFVEENTQYTVSLIKTAARVNIAAYDTNDTLLEVVATWSSAQSGAQETTFTTPENTKYIACATGRDLVSNVQIEQGNTATDYVPYFDGGTATAEMLLKLGDYQDVQSIIDGVVTRNVGVKVFDGTENISVASDYYQISNAFLCDSDDKALTICSHYKYGTIFNYGEFRILTNGSTIRFNIGTFTTASEVSQWLAAQYAAGTPVIVIYPLATPTTESVTGQTLQVTDGDNTLEITQASLNNLELEAKYKKRK